MTYRARVKNGQIVLDQPAQLREGATLTVIETAPAIVSPASLDEYIKHLPPGTRDKADIDQQIANERDSWGGR